MLRRSASLVALALMAAGPARAQTRPEPVEAGAGTAISGWALRSDPDGAGGAAADPARASATDDPARRPAQPPEAAESLDAALQPPGPATPDPNLAEPTAPATRAAVPARRRPAIAAGERLVRPAAARRALEPAAPVPPGLRRTLDDPYAEEEAFAPSGISTAGFVLLPAIEAGIGATSNVAGGAGGRAGAVTTVAPELKARSDWSRHALDLDLRGSYAAYPGNRDYDRPSLAATAQGRVDLADGMRLDLRGGLTLEREQAGSAENPAGTEVPSDVTTWTGSAGFTRDAGLVWAALRADVAATRYSGGRTAGGGVLADTGARDNTRLAGALRAGYHLSPALGPYVEVELARRDYADRAVGTARDADGWALRGGVVVDLGPTLKGEVAAGWAVERPRSAALADLSGATLDGSLVWSPTRLTRVTLTAKTAFEPTTVAGSSGSVAHGFAATVSHALGRGFSAEAGAGVELRRYQGTGRREADYAGSAALVYALSPTAQIFLRGQVERFVPSAPDPAYDVETVMVGLRLQR